MQQAVRRYALALAALAAAAPALSQQRADTAADTSVAAPAFATGSGPIVLIDEAHANFHRLDGRYAAFGAVLRADGYSVRASAVKFSAEALKDARVLVIANARAPKDGATFDDEEIAVLHSWVERGGALFLITDHAPYSASAAPLAKSFGFTIATEPVTPDTQPEIFSRTNGGLIAGQISDGDGNTTKIEAIRTFYGTAFQAPDGAIPVLRLDDHWRIGTRPATAQDLRGAVMAVGHGRIAIFGEAGMFSAQLAGKMNRPMGFNAPGAEQNEQFLLGVMHWLTPPPPAIEKSPDQNLPLISTP